MFPEKKMLIFHVESSLHAGAGSSVGHIDNPIQREISTGNPIVQSNGVKGALREFFEKQSPPPTDKITAAFGGEDGSDGAGAVSFGEARLLFLPVRSLAGIFAYITCPYLINRFQRELIALGKAFIPDSINPANIWQPQMIGSGSYLAHTDCLVQISANGAMVLEELPFNKDTNANVDSPLATLADLIFPVAAEYRKFREDFIKRAVVLDDADYFYFARYAMEVEPHNRIDDATGTVDPNTGVWYTEYLPSESILSCPLFIGAPHIQNSAFSSPTNVKIFVEELNEKRAWLGGDRTTGKGRVMMHLF